MADMTIVMPVHNEADFIQQGLGGLLRIVDAIDADIEILVVENGSTDETAAMARNLGGTLVTVIENPIPDYGDAMRTGFLRAQGDWIVNVDVDYYSESFLRSVLASDADIVIGSKRDPHSQDRRPLVRRVATRVFNLLLRVLLGSGVSDTHGLKGFRSDKVLPLIDQVVSRQDLFDTELVLRCERSGLVIEEIPVVVEELREARSSLFARVPRTVRGLIRIRRLLSA